VGAPLVEVREPRVLGVDRDGIEVDLPGLGPTRISLRGRHQAQNAAVADAVLDALGRQGTATVDAAARKAGYASATWPGRLELIRVRDRDVVLDGAHNPAGAAALAQAIDDLRPFLAAGPVTLVHGSMGDKDVDGIIRALLESNALVGARLFTTQVPGDRAMPAGELARHWRATRPDLEVTVIADAGTALDRAVATPASGTAGPVVVAGSLYLVGEARRRWLDDPLLRDPEEVVA
jgi:dihydrofolate synthase/folylpolyglutamate synthase